MSPRTPTSRVTTTRGAALAAALLLAAPAAADDWVIAPRPAGESVQQQHRVQLDQQIDGMLQRGGEPDMLRKRLGARLDLQVQALDVVCGLTEAQREKCAAAADLQIAALLDEVDALRARYAGVSIDFRDATERKVFEQMQREVQPLAQKLQRGGGRDTLLDRVMQGVLDARQRALWDAQTRRRDDYRWAAAVSAGVMQMEVALGLTSTQCDQLRRLLEDKPMRISGEGLRTQPNLFTFAAFYALSQVEEAKLKPLFTDRQWQLVSQFRAQGQGMRDHLRTVGILEE